jgi:hypothetical protein
MNIREVNLNLTLRKIFWGAFAIGAGLLCGVATVVSLATMLRGVARYLGVSA